MARSHSKTFLAFGDVHIPHQSAPALEVFCQAAERIGPDLIICLGDLLDCGQFSAHPPTYGMPETDYVEDLRVANALLDRLQATCGRLVIVEGNHEYRLDRWAAATAEGRGAYSMLAPRIRLMKGRSKCTYVPYGSVAGRYPHYQLNSRVIAVHGWSYAKHATKNHLQISQGKSVIHGHCLPTDYEALTEDGWKRIVDVRKGEAVIGYQRGQILKTRVLDTVLHENWTGRMAHFDHPAIRQTMTELHGIYTRDDQYLHVRDAEGLAVNDLVLRAVPIRQESTRSELTPDELRLIVATCSDAHFDPRWRNIRFHIRKRRKVRRLISLLDALGHNYSVTPSSAYPDAVRINIRGESKKRLWRLLDGQKVLPSWLAELDATQIQVVVDELKLWDGSCLRHSGRDHGCRQFVSHKPAEVDLVQQLLALIGCFSTRSRKGTVVCYNEFREGAKTSKTLGDIVEWRDVAGTDTACISTGTYNFICRTPSGSVELTGNTHRADTSIVQNIWSPGKVIQARSSGCLCKPIPLYGTGRPVEWVNAFILGYLGRRSDTLYTIPILDGRCILPDGAEVAA